MGSINARYGNLYVDFRYLNMRCREVTALKDNATNRKKLEKILERIEAEILLDIFDYGKYFPKSKKLAEIEETLSRKISIQSQTPLFKDFCETWFSEKEIEWRVSYQGKIRTIINKYLNPSFGHIVLSHIDKEAILAFRAALAKVRHGKKQERGGPTCLNN